jgi:nucleotide-binding universal stress UspA family protein
MVKSLLYLAKIKNTDCMSDKKFIVPHDFSIVGDTALNHAIKVAKTVGGTVHLLHVVSKPTQVEEAHNKLAQIAHEATKADNVKVEAIVRIGNIFDDIAEYAEEIKASLVFMGTHGARGWQKISGSHAMKVIESTFTPFVVVQQRKIKETGYDDIVVPLDLSKNTQQKLRIVSEMAQYFKSKAHIVMPKANDSDDRIDLNLTLAFAKKHMAEHNIEYDVEVVEGDFAKEIIKYAVKHECDLIAIVNNSVERVGGNLFASSSEQALITNDAQIPVVLLNPKDLTTGGSVFFN